LTDNSVTEMADKCWDCKHNILKMKVMVPQDQTIRECMNQTSNLLSNITAIIKEKKEQYIMSLRSGDEMKKVTVKMLNICQLKIERTDINLACSCYKQNGSQTQVSNIIYSKEPNPKILEKYLAIKQ